MPTYLGQLIRDARHQTGQTLEEVAEKVGITSGALSHIESGRRLPQSYNAVAIAEALGVPRDEILRALDDEHASRRRSSADRGTTSSLGSLGPARASRSSDRLYSARPIEELFGESPASPEDVRVPSRSALSSAPEPSVRQTARWSADTRERLIALEQLADSAADAIRTLRGLLDDEDPAISREARRLLRELDVRAPEE
jgi:transcriptional regulator with XRE-family HTH domain